MVSSYFIALRRLSRILWVRIALILALSILAAVLTPLLDPLIPEVSKDRFSREATLPILTILANSMLAVTTFSLGIMVTTHRTTADQTTPRIHRLLLDDTRTQTVLATFIGAFVFALLSIILFRAGYYTPSGAVIVFFMTAFVVAVVVVSMVRWIDHLARLGSMDYALSRAEDTARETLTTLKRWPALGADTLAQDAVIPLDALPICATKSGYLLQLDIDGLGEAAEKHDAKVYIDTLPGDTVLDTQTIACVSGHDAPEDFEKYFSITPHRAYDQDARYAIQTLRETASKALSPGINDPGTAMEVVVRLERLLWDWCGAEPNDDPVRCPRIYLRSLKAGTLFEIAFNDIARDGAGFVDILVRIHKALSHLLTVAPDDDARATARRLMGQVDSYAENGLTTDFEKDSYRSRTR